MDEPCSALDTIATGKSRNSSSKSKLIIRSSRSRSESVNIAHRVLDLNQEPSLKLNEDISKLARVVQEMIREAMDAFVYHRPETARDVIKRDDDADRMTKTLHAELVGMMTRAPSEISRFLCLLSIALNLERTADYATNIAEEVVYLYEAKDIRHHKP